MTAARGRPSPEGEAIDGRAAAVDAAFDLLASWRRRWLLRRLTTTSLTERAARWLAGQHGGEPLADLAERLAAAENGVAVSEVTSQQRKRAYISLYQTHVPRLAEAGVVEWDRDAGTVAATPRAAELVALVDRAAVLADGGGDEQMAVPRDFWLWKAGLLLLVGAIGYAAWEGTVTGHAATAVALLALAGAFLGGWGVRGTLDAAEEVADDGE